MNRSERAAILRSLPDTLDLLTIGVESGWSLEQSAQFITQRYNSPLAVQLGIVIGDINQGQDRTEAWHELAARCNLPELSSAVAAIVNTGATGGALVPVLRLQSEAARSRARQRIEEQIRKAPVKMLPPMVGCVFPSVLITLLAPAVINVLQNVLHKI